MSKLLRFEAIKDLVQETVDRGVTGAETIHKTIADIPFDALDRSGKLEERGQSIRDLQRNTIGSIYSTIRKVSRELGDMASNMIEALEDHDDAQSNISRAEQKRRKNGPGGPATEVATPPEDTLAPEDTRAPEDTDAPEDTP